VRVRVLRGASEQSSPTIRGDALMWNRFALPPKWRSRCGRVAALRAPQDRSSGTRVQGRGLTPPTCERLADRGFSLQYVVEFGTLWVLAMLGVAPRITLVIDHRRPGAFRRAARSKAKRRSAGISRILLLAPTNVVRGSGLAERFRAPAPCHTQPYTPKQPCARGRLRGVQHSRGDPARDPSRSSTGRSGPRSGRAVNRPPAGASTRQCN
jgi:hypothetical protein